ncbi:MAG: hypothetical protein HY287_13620 [Planctomycetes bacterium]|nr:hypothetical protein [Planctomycetota bacterium]MBI3835361.1 hypothetical protein [Planctomycetota bacterium]
MVESIPLTLEQFYEQPPDPVKHGGCGSCGTGKNAGERCGNGLEKIYPTTAVRFGYMRYIGEFTHAPDLLFTCGAKVVIQTRRGIEVGEQVSLTCGGCDKSVTRDQMKQWVDACGEDAYSFDAGRILREATAADLAENARMQNMNPDRKRFARQAAARHNLPIRIVECETLFGGERMVFYFTSEQRVDFRNMVRDMTQEFRTRIEMRQVGARDEARLLADYETCGREVCCKVFLKTLRPITMRMAKLQKATLDPSQVSGRCGRLKCCLRYEHVGYEELDKQLPRTGIRIRTNHGDGVIVNRQVLTQLVQLRKDDGTLITVVAEDITEVGIAAPPPPAEGMAPSGAPPSQGRRPGPPPRDRNAGRRLALEPSAQPAELAPIVGGPPFGEPDPNFVPMPPPEQLLQQGQRPPRAERPQMPPVAPQSERQASAAPQAPDGPQRRGRRRRGGRGMGPEGRPGNQNRGTPGASDGSTASGQDTDNPGAGTSNSSRPSPPSSDNSDDTPPPPAVQS